VIVATGAKVDTAQLAANGIDLDGRGRACLKDSGEASVPGVYVIGDAKAGPKTVVAAMADAKAAATDILGQLGIAADFQTFPLACSREDLLGRKGVLAASVPDDAGADSARCLGCSSVCEICVDVCPNRANVAVSVPGGGQPYQILHLDALCNECGNCAVFCPSAGRPYADKWTLFASEADFNDSQNQGFWLKDGAAITRCEAGTGQLPEPVQRLTQAVLDGYRYLLV